MGPSAAIGDITGTQNTSSFEDLYRDHVDEVYSLTLRMTGDVHTAEDITQEIFVRVWNKLATFRGDSSFRTWLYRLSLNVILRQRARFRKHAQNSLEDSQPLQRDGSETVIIRADIQRAILTLPVRCRAVFVLYDLEQYAHGEIAQMLNISDGTSKAHLFRARKLMRKELER